MSTHHKRARLFHERQKTASVYTATSTALPPPPPRPTKKRKSTRINQPDQQDLLSSSNAPIEGATKSVDQVGSVLRVSGLEDNLIEKQEFGNECFYLYPEIFQQKVIDNLIVGLKNFGGSVKLMNLNDNTPQSCFCHRQHWLIIPSRKDKADRINLHEMRNDLAFFHNLSDRYQESTSDTIAQRLQKAQQLSAACVQADSQKPAESKANGSLQQRRSLDHRGDSELRGVPNKHQDAQKVEIVLHHLSKYDFTAKRASLTAFKQEMRAIQIFSVEWVLRVYCPILFRDCPAYAAYLWKKRPEKAEKLARFYDEATDSSNVKTTGQAPPASDHEHRTPSTTDDMRPLPTVAPISTAKRNSETMSSSTLLSIMEEPSIDYLVSSTSPLDAQPRLTHPVDCANHRVTEESSIQQVDHSSETLEMDDGAFRNDNADTTVLLSGSGLNQVEEGPHSTSSLPPESPQAALRSTSPHSSPSNCQTPICSGADLAKTTTTTTNPAVDLNSQFNLETSPGIITNDGVLPTAADDRIHPSGMSRALEDGDQEFRKDPSSLQNAPASSEPHTSVFFFGESEFDAWDSGDED